MRVGDLGGGGGVGGGDRGGGGGGGDGRGREGGRGRGRGPGREGDRGGGRHRGRAGADRDRQGALGDAAEPVGDGEGVGGSDGGALLTAAHPGHAQLLEQHRGGVLHIPTHGHTFPGSDGDLGGGEGDGKRAGVGVKTGVEVGKGVDVKAGVKVGGGRPRGRVHRRLLREGRGSGDRGGRLRLRERRGEGFLLRRGGRGCADRRIRCQRLVGRGGGRGDEDRRPGQGGRGRGQNQRQRGGGGGQGSRHQRPQAEIAGDAANTKEDAQQNTTQDDGHRPVAAPCRRDRAHRGRPIHGGRRHACGHGWQRQRRHLHIGLRLGRAVQRHEPGTTAIAPAQTKHRLLGKRDRLARHRRIATVFEAGVAQMRLGVVDQAEIGADGGSHWR